MPRSPRAVTVVLLLAGCTPAELTWPGEGPMALQRYRRSFAAAAGTRFVAAVPRAALLDEISRTGAVWLGDHHRHSLLHGLHLELLTELFERGVPLALGLEAIGVDDQQDVDAFLAGGIELTALRQRMRARWSGSWLDDPELDTFYFRALLQLARKHGAPVFALEPTPRLPLRERDPRIAAAAAKARRHWPDRTIAVVVGQTHLLGEGDVVARSGIGGVVLGGKPPPELRACAPPPAGDGTCWQTDAGTLWFDRMLGTER